MLRCPSCCALLLRLVTSYETSAMKTVSKKKDQHQQQKKQQHQKKQQQQQHPFCALVKSKTLAIVFATAVTLLSLVGFLADAGFLAPEAGDPRSPRRASASSSSLRAPPPAPTNTATVGFRGFSGKLFGDLVDVRKGKKGGKLVKVVPFVHSDPNVYKGPVVEGWPPGKVRDLAKYVRSDFLLEPKWSSSNSSDDDAASGVFRIAFVVFSSPGAAVQRQSVRDTWALDLRRHNSTLVFLLGRDPNEEDGGISDKVREEADLRGDLLVADVVDHYNNLTLKSMLAIKFFLSLEKRIQKPPRYLFKLDDDSYVNLLPLSKMLKQLERRSPEGDFLLGRTLGRDPKPIQISEKARGKKFTDKWACPSYMFSGGHYPPTLSGAGYAMTLGAARCLYQKLLLLPFFHLEDVFVTGFGAQECSGLPVITTNRFWNVPSTLKHMDTRNDILFHYKDSDAKRLIFKVLLFDRLVQEYNVALGNKSKGRLIVRQGKNVASLKEKVPGGPRGALLQVVGAFTQLASQTATSEESHLVIRKVVTPLIAESEMWQSK